MAIRHKTQLVSVGNQLCESSNSDDVIVKCFIQDHWKPVDPWDNRRYYGNRYMRELGQSQAATMDGLLQVLGEWPLRNNGTAYTTVMCPSSLNIRSFDVFVV